MHQKSRTLIPKHGLGNRLLAISAGLRLIDLRIFTNLQIWWYPSTDLNCEIDDILDNPFTITKPPSPGIARTPPVPLNSDIAIEAFSPFTYINDPTPPGVVTNQLRAAIKKLKFHKRYDDLIKNYDMSNMVGLHCRRSDYQRTNADTTVDQIFEYHRYLDTAFANAVEQLLPNEQLFLATDCPITDRYFKSFFKSRLISIPKQHYPDWSTRSYDTMMESVVDMLLLSKCQKIIGDSCSSFSIAASWIGGIERLTWLRPSVRNKHL